MCNQECAVEEPTGRERADCGRPTSVATTSDDAVWMIRVMTDIGAAPIVAGGWGVDALVGAQSRPHRDLDVLVQAEFVEAITNRLLDEGFVVTTDWLPVRVEMSDLRRDRHVDIHPIFDDSDAGWWQHGLDDAKFECSADDLTVGRIGDTPVRCLSAARQRDLHTGYPHRGEDAHDVALLHRLLETPR